MSRYASAEERFLAKVNKTSTCWLWTAAKAGPRRMQYGVIFYQGKQERAHRVSYKMYVGPIPEGLFVLHTCDVPACVNPDHLWVGTQKQNMHDMIAKGRNLEGETQPMHLRPACAARGEESGTSKLTDEEVVAIRELRAEGFTHSYLAARFGVSRRNIGFICRREAWKHVL